MSDFRIAAMADEFRVVLHELAVAKEQLRTVHASHEDVWFWQGDGTDHTASLSCPVVMSAHTLRDLSKKANDTSFYQRENSRLRVDHEALVEQCAQLREQVRALSSLDASSGATALSPVAPFRHVDDFIEDHKQDAYARFVLQHFRLSADLRIAFWPFMVGRRLFCTYAGRQWRVTGASSLGDVFLAKDLESAIGYDTRVAADDCAEWAPAPQGERTEFDVDAARFACAGTETHVPVAALVLGACSEIERLRETGALVPLRSVQVPETSDYAVTCSGCSQELDAPHTWRECSLALRSGHPERSP